jgi:uncharacterized protein (DUF433 family)
LIEPSHGDLFTFVDLVSLLVMSELYKRGVSTDDLRAGGAFLVRELQTERPFAHETLATVGSEFYARLDAGGVGAWYNAGRGGQGAFESIILPVLRPIEYGSDSMASLWRPHDRVWINPKVQAGTPCVDATRIPTAALADMASAEDDLEDLADDYEIDIADIRAAIGYEKELLDLKAA